LITSLPGPLDTCPAPDASTGPQPGLPFTRQQRLLSAKEFAVVFADAPLRASHPSFLILARNNHLGRARLGLVVPKKHVRKANMRNRIKRVARETFRKEQHKLAAIDAIVLARRGADTVPAEQLTSIFTGLWKRISKRAIAPSP
jgi:ribonuclease P protein component